MGTFPMAGRPSAWMSVSPRLGAALACFLQLGCTPKDDGAWCGQETEVALLAQTPSGIPMLRIREVQGPFQVELEWSATRHAFPSNGGVHPTQAVFGGDRTVATFSVEPRGERAMFWQGEERGECNDNILFVPVSLELRTDDGRIDATFEAEAEFHDDQRSVLGTSTGLPIPGLELAHCDPKATSAGFDLHDGEFRPSLTVTCEGQPDGEGKATPEPERMMIPNEMYVLGTWFRP